MGRVLRIKKTLARSVKEEGGGGIQGKQTVSGQKKLRVYMRKDALSNVGVAPGPIKKTWGKGPTQGRG